MSLRWKIAAAMATLAGIVAALAAIGSFVATRDQLNRSIDDSLIDRASAAAVISNRRPPGDPNRAPDHDSLRCPAATALRSIAHVQIISANGQTVACESTSYISVTASDLSIAAGNYDSIEAAPFESGDVDGDLRYSLRTERIDGHEYRVITAALPTNSNGAIQMARDNQEGREILENLIVRLLLVAAGCVVVAAAVGFALATRIVRPVKRLTNTAHHIAQTGDLSSTIPAGGSDEIGSLADSFRTMVASVARSQDQQTRLISDASHEMRTPLTSLRTNLELLARAEQQPADRLPADARASLIDDLQFETQELTTLLTELVELATDRSNGEAVETVDLGSLAENVVERSVRRTGRNIALVTPTELAATINGRPHQVERALTNLVENAVKYSPDGTNIEVSATGSRLVVRDHGPGIAPEDLPHVFDRFYRATAVRTLPGSGLGLAIVEQIAQGHNGTVTVENHPEGGAIVTLDLPGAEIVERA